MKGTRLRITICPSHFIREIKIKTHAQKRKQTKDLASAADWRGKNGPPSPELAISGFRGRSDVARALNSTMELPSAVGS